MKRTSLFYAFSLILVCSSVVHIWAKAPNTAKIVFVSARDGNRELYLMNPDGSEQVKITNHRADEITPVWSPTGEQIIFASDRDADPGHGDLYLMDPDGSNVRPVFAKSADRQLATWSPDEKWIAYTRREPSGSFIYIATIDGKNEERVAIGSGPAWSPDGTEIAFRVSLKKEHVQISLLNVHTRKQKVIFPPKAIPSWMGGRIVWSPRGDKLAFSWLNRVPLKDFLETETIYTVNRDGTRLTQIVDEAGPRAISSAWSPNGDELIYTQEIDNYLQLFKVDLSSRIPIQLTHIVGLSRFQANSQADWFDPAFALAVSPQPQLLSTIWGKVKKR